MNLAEYLKLRGTAANALTSEEARILGIELRQGWVKRHAGVEVPQSLVEAAIARRLPYKKRGDKKTPKEMPPKSAGKPPAITFRHKIVATQYLQQHGRLLGTVGVVAGLDSIERELFALLDGDPAFDEKYRKAEYGVRHWIVDTLDVSGISDKDCNAAGVAKKRAKRAERHQVERAKKQARKALQTRTSPPRFPAGKTTVEGVDVRSKDFLSTYAWTNLRIKALNLYGRKCMCCGDSPENGAVMNVDHIKPRVRNPELALDVRNTQILCQLCNKGKCNELETDYRSPAQIAAANAAALVM